jgi:class 3 adenylate cyclase
MVGAAERDGTLNATPQAHDALIGRFIMHSHTENVKSKGKMACYTVSGVLTARRDSSTGLRPTMRPSMRSTFQSGDDSAAPLPLPISPATPLNVPQIQASSGSNSGAAPLRIRSTHHSHSRLKDENSMIDDLESRLRAEWMTKQLKRMKAEQQRRVQRVDRQSKEVSVHYFTCKFRRADLETRWQRMFHFRSITPARVSLALLAAFHVFRMTQALVTNDVFIGSDALRHNPHVVREVVVHIGISLLLMLFLFVSMVCCSPPAATVAALDADAAPEGESVSSSGGPDIVDSFSGYRSRFHELMLLLGGLAMTMAGHDALATTLDIMFFFAVVSNSGAVPFITALVINGCALIAFTAVALASNWNDVQPTTTMWFFLASTYVMVAVSSGSVEYFRRHRFGIAQLTADEVHRNTFMLYRMLPVPIAKLLLQNDDNKYVSQSISGVTILFCDIQGFTKLSAAATPSQIIGMLNRLFTAFDALTEVHGVFKLMTIGDCFVVVAGVPYEDVPADVEMAQTRRRRVSLLTAARMVGKIQRTVSTSQWLYSAASRVFSRKATKSRPRLDFRQRPGNKNNKNYRTFPMEFLDQENENDYRQKMRNPSRFGSSPLVSPDGFSPNRQLAAMLHVDVAPAVPPATAREVEEKDAPVSVPVVFEAGSDPGTPIIGADEKQNDDNKQTAEERSMAATGVELTSMRSSHVSDANTGMAKLATINEDTPTDNLETNTNVPQAAPSWKGMFTTMASVDGMDVTDLTATGVQTTSTKIQVASPEPTPQSRKSFRSPAEREAHLGRNGKSLWALSRNIVRALVGTISVDHEETGSAQDLRNLAESSANDLKNVGTAAKTMGSSSHSNEVAGADLFGPSTPVASPKKEKDPKRPSIATPEGTGVIEKTSASPASQSPAQAMPYVPPTPFPELEWAALSDEGKVSLEPIQYNAVSMLRMAVDMVDCTRRVLNPITGEPIQMRFGLHTGNIVGGVIGTKTFRYDMFGSDVLAANEMEANGLGGGVVVSQATHDVLCTVQQTKYAIPGLSFLPHTPCAIKGVGVMNSYIVILEGVPLADKASENEHG